MHVFIGNTGATATATAAELGECGVQEAGIPQDDGVQDQAKGSELIFLASR